MTHSHALLVGQFVPGETWLHRADPRSKLVATVAISAVLLHSAAWQVQLSLAMLVAVLAVVSRFPLRMLVVNLRPFVWLFVIISLAHSLWSGSEGQVLVQFWGMTATLPGLLRGVIYSLRLATLITVAMLLMMTTMPLDLMDGVGRLLRPLRRVRVPIDELTVMMGLALRFIPTLFSEAERIRQAQRSRGANLEGGPLQRLRAVVAMVVPLFVAVFRRADDLAMAMESRCYTPGGKRSQYRELSFNAMDHMLIFASLLLVLASWFLKTKGWPV